jgi:hypothetical protein
MKAFPHTAYNGNDFTNEQANGMDLLDYFAGIALQGQLTRMGTPYPLAARTAYDYAEAMLKERNERKASTS